MRPKRLTNVISLRLSPKIRERLEGEADFCGLSLAEFIRKRLDDTYAAVGIIKEIRDELLYYLGRKSISGDSEGARIGASGLVDDALLIELVLGMRQILSIQQLRDVKMSVAGLGLEPWTAEDVR
jgi:hypothetical protein